MLPVRTITIKISSHRMLSFCKENITKLKGSLSLGELKFHFLSNRAQIGKAVANNLGQSLLVVLDPIFGALTFILSNQYLLNLLAIRSFSVETDVHQP